MHLLKGRKRRKRIYFVNNWRKNMINFIHMICGWSLGIMEDEINRDYII